MTLTQMFNNTLKEARIKMENDRRVKKDIKELLNRNGYSTVAETENTVVYSDGEKNIKISENWNKLDEELNQYPHESSGLSESEEY